MIQERGVWPRHRPSAVFWAPAGAKKTGLSNLMHQVDTLLGGITARIKLCDGSHLNVVDNSDLIDFISHPTWFEGDEVALPRGDRLCLLGELTGRSPKGAGMQSLDWIRSLRMWSSLSLWRQRNMSLSQKELALNQTRWQLTTMTAMTILRAPGSFLAANQMKVIQNIHNNCGRPSKEEFLRAHRLSHARPEVLNCVRREFECPACSAKGHLPKPRLPAVLPPTFRFNEMLGVDLFEIESPDGSKITFCNLVCWGTLYQLCIPVPDKTAATVAKCITERWIQYFGPPLVMIADQGKEFVGTQFKEVTNANSIFLHIIDVRAPWQNGRTERHGGIYKNIFELARWLHSPSGPAALQRLAMECNAAKNRLSNRSGYSPLQRVFGIGHRLLSDLTSDDIYAPEPIHDLAATDASFEESRQIRDAAMKAHAEVSIRDRIEDSVRARPRTPTVLRADDVIMVWKKNQPSKRGRWVGPGVCIGTHRGSVWVNMRGSLWKCSQLQCKLATMKAEFQEFPGRRVYSDIEREGVPPKDVDRPQAAPRAVEEEEDIASALLLTVPLLTSSPPSLPEIDRESQQSLREALQSENAASSVPPSSFSPPNSDRLHSDAPPKNDTLASETEKQKQRVQTRESDHPMDRQEQHTSPEELTAGWSPSNQMRERHHEVADEPPAQRPRLESPASAIRWSRTAESGHWTPVTGSDAEEHLWVETDPEMLWRQQVDDRIWENIGKPVRRFQEEWSDLVGSHMIISLRT